MFQQWYYKDFIIILSKYLYNQFNEVNEQLKMLFDYDYAYNNIIIKKKFRI